MAQCKLTYQSRTSFVNDHISHYFRAVSSGLTKVECVRSCFLLHPRKAFYANSQSKHNKGGHVPMLQPINSLVEGIMRALCQTYDSVYINIYTYIFV